MHLQQTIWPLTMVPALQAVSEPIWFVTLLFALCAGWTDWRTRRIPNWLTVSGMLMGIAANSTLGGWHGVKGSLAGAGLALGLLLPVVLLRGLGAGDWKLMGGLGALLGWQAMLFVLVVSILVSGLMAIVQMISTRRVKITLRNLLTLAKGLVTFGLRADLAEISLDNPTLLKVPFGVGVAVATVFSFALARWPQ
jgi:prepilin peptidase CpaA